MAFIHHTTLVPSKTELLAQWLPGRPWYRGGTSVPSLVKSGGFRLDDPEGEVGLEFMIVTDVSDVTGGSANAPQAYLVPITYRGTPLDGAEHALIGTMEHAVLGRRWTYDGCADPVLVSELLSLIQGRAQAAAQSITDTPDPEVVRSYTGAPFGFDLFTPEPADDPAGTLVPTPQGTRLHVRRALDPVPGPAAPSHAPGDDVLGHVARGWLGPAGEELTAVLITLHRG